MVITDLLRLINPALAVIIVFPLIGTAVNLASQSRQRRLQTANKGKSKIPPVAGPEHRCLGELLTGAVVGLTLLGLAYPIAKNIIKKQLCFSPTTVFIILMFIATVASLAFLFKAKKKLWRGTFATLTGMGLLVIGAQYGVYHRNNEWYWSHYYYGIIAALLMILSLAIIP